MKRFAFVLTASAFITLGLCGAALTAEAHEHKAFGGGFHSLEAPLGFRYWLGSQKVALDLGLGFASEPAAIDPNEKEKRYAFEAGVPFVIRSWDRAHALLRPGLLYQSQQIGFDAEPGTPGLQYDTNSETTLDVLLECEAEVYLVDNISVSAAHGFSFRRFDPVGGDSETSFGTRGNNFTTLGFHLYLY